MRMLWMFAAFWSVTCALAQTMAPVRPWRFELIEGSSLQDDCPICGRPTIQLPMRGSFELAPDNTDPIFTSYTVTNVQFYVGDKSSPNYTVTGSGRFTIGGHLAVLQDMTLAGEVCAEVACRAVAFTNDDRGVRLTFPLIDISLTQTQQSLLSVYKIRIVAAPVRELWFMVTNTFTPTNGAPLVRAGDVLERSGRRVRTREWLLESNGVPNPPPALRLDALDVAPGGDLLFSTGDPNVTPLHEGDLLSANGGVRRSNQQLTAAFGIMPVVPDVGLDAVHVTDAGEILFSIRTNIFAEGKGLMLKNGDVLSDKGEVVKSNQQLLERFQPSDPVADYGLDALYVWPNGEIWFSTARGFQDLRLGPVSEGDLLSSEGIIVFRSSELLAEFAPPITSTNLGLADIFVVTDAAVGPRPVLAMPRLAGTDVWLQWTGTNRVFMVERAPAVTGPWQPVGPIDPALFRRDPGGAFAPQGFYRLQGW
jgi:hypothetical protein